MQQPLDVLTEGNRELILLDQHWTVQKCAPNNPQVLVQVEIFALVVNIYIINNTG